MADLNVFEKEIFFLIFFDDIMQHEFRQDKSYIAKCHYYFTF